MSHYYNGNRTRLNHQPDAAQGSRHDSYGAARYVYKRFEYNGVEMVLTGQCVAPDEPNNDALRSNGAQQTYK